MGPSRRGRVRGWRRAPRAREARRRRRSLARWGGVHVTCKIIVTCRIVNRCPVAYTRDMPKRYGQSCPVAKSLEVLGDRWTLLLVRDLLRGTRRFQDLRRGCRHRAEYPLRPPEADGASPPGPPRLFRAPAAGPVHAQRARAGLGWWWARWRTGARATSTAARGWSMRTAARRCARVSLRRVRHAGARQPRDLRRAGGRRRAAPKAAASPLPSARSSAPRPGWYHPP